MTEVGKPVSFGLEALTAPLGADEFLSHFWPSEFYVGHGSIQRLQGLAEIEALASVEAFLKVASGPVRVWPGPDHRGEIATVVSPAEALARYRDGWTVYVNEAEHSVIALIPYIRKLEADLGVRHGDIATELFASKAGAGARPHCDFDLGFNIQLSGRKAWRVAPNAAFSDPHLSVIISEHFDADVAAYATGEIPTEMPSKGVRELVAEPGTVIFLPRGFWHTTMACDASLALTFACKGRMWSQLLTRELARKLRLRERWRAFPAPLGGAPMAGDAENVKAENVKALEALLADLHDVLDQLSPAELVEQWNRPELPLYRAASKADSQIVHDAVPGSPGVFLRVAREGEGQRLLKLAPEQATVVAFIVSSAVPVAARDVAQLVPCSLAEAEAAIAALVHEGVIEPA